MAITCCRAGEMSDTYRSTSTMSWPDAPLIDYMQKETMWAALRLDKQLSPEALAVKMDFLPEAKFLHTPQLGSPFDDKPMSTTPTSPSATSSNEPPDWLTMDMSLFDTLPGSFEELDDPETTTKPTAQNLIPTPSNAPVNEDDFYAGLLGGDTLLDTTSSPSTSDEQAEDTYAFEDEYEEDEPISAQTIAARLNILTQPIICHNFLTPTAWLDNTEFVNHVGYEIWSKYGEQYFDDSRDNWDDLATILSTKHVQNITDMYLTDHRELKHKNDIYKYWSRLLTSKLNNTPFTNESIPIYLTPDLDRGVKYSNNIIEMKGKMVLETYLPPPAELFINDTFTHNEELETLNKIGRIKSI